MPVIQVGSYSFTIEDPYSEGHRLSAAEAKALNSQRTERVRNIIYKRLNARLSAEGLEPGGGLLSASDLRDFTNEVKELDRDFSFVPHLNGKVNRNTVQAEIYEVALEVTRARMRQNSIGELDENEVEMNARLACSEVNVIEEGRRRFTAHQEITKLALADLMK